MLFGRRFVTGPADSLGRLKRAAEQASNLDGYVKDGGLAQ
jgi:hypothetical protein